MKTTQSSRLTMLAAALGVLVFAIATSAYIATKPWGSAASGVDGKEAITASSGSSVNLPGTSTERVVATVGKIKLTESDLAGAGGGDRPIVVDRLISQVIAASLAERDFSAEAEAAASRTRREVLSALYLQRKTQQLRSAVSDEQVKAFYESELKDEQFTTYKVSYVVAPDASSLNPVVAAITSGKPETVSTKFTPLRPDGDGFARAADMPMGIGQLIAAMKAGDYSRPLVLRNGVFIFKLEGVKAQPKPEMASVRESIKDLLVARQLDSTLGAARKATDIRIL